MRNTINPDELLEAVCRRESEYQAELVQKLRELLGRRSSFGHLGHMVLLFGGTRIERDTFVRQALPEVDRFVFQASGQSLHEDRRRLLHEALAWAGEDRDHRDEISFVWVFKRLLNLRPNSPLVLVIDGFEHLLGGDDDPASALVAAWETPRNWDPHARPLILILSGNNAQALKRQMWGDMPLYGRMSLYCDVRPPEERVRELVRRQERTII